MDKVKNRLTTWKEKTLSLAGRITLTKVVISAMPQYYMQTTKLPLSLCEEVERTSRSFIWGDIENKKGIHLVA